MDPALFTFPFMQRALLAAAMTGFIAPCIGTYIVQRKLSLLGDGLGHLAIAGVGLAIATGTAPLPVAIVVCIAGAVVVELMRQYGRASADVGLAILFYGGLAFGIAMASLAGQGTGVLSQFLFGSLMSVSDLDLYLILGLGILIAVPTLGLMPQLFAICADETYATVLGLRVKFLNFLIVVLASVTIAISMRTVGLLLVSALMVVPVAAASNIVNGFTKGVFVAIGIGVLSSLSGVVGSYQFDMAPGALIVLTTIAIFIVSAIAAPIVERRQRGIPEVPFVDMSVFPHSPKEDHPHEHGDDCGHAVVWHGDHQDYIHDGHLHAKHGDHYDDH